MKRRLPALNLCAFFQLLMAGMLCIASFSACVKLPRRYVQMNGQTAPPVSERITPRLNINTASAEELEKLPGIGEGLAKRIIDYRQEYGRFRRPEHLLMVRGISTRRFRAMQALITAE